MSELPLLRPVTAGEGSRAPLLARALRLEYITLAWALFEALAGLYAAAAAGSVALLGFGTDSVIEVASAAILAARLHAEPRAADPAAVRRLDRIARRLVAALLVVLAGYIAFDAIATLVAGRRPLPSPLGIALMVVTIAVMFVLARAKRRAAAALDSCALHADSFQATACMWLSAATLAGTGLNAALGWWWADPVAALAMPPLLLVEARKAWRGEHCGC